MRVIMYPAQLKLDQAACSYGTHVELHMLVLETIEPFNGFRKSRYLLLWFLGSPEVLNVSDVGLIFDRTLQNFGKIGNNPSQRLETTHLSRQSLYVQVWGRET